MKQFVLPNGQQAMLDFMAQLDPRERYEVTIAKYEKPRSLGHNNYYFGFVCTPLAQFCGETPERTHEHLCGEYWGWVEKEFRGHKYRKPRRTTTTNENGERDVLKGEPFQAFVHFAESVCAEMGVPINYDRKAVEMAA